MLSPKLCIQHGYSLVVTDLLSMVTDVLTMVIGNICIHHGYVTIMVV